MNDPWHDARHTLPGAAPAIRPGDYLDVRACTPVTITRDGDVVTATWRDGNPDTKQTTAEAIIAGMISRGILTPMALAPADDAGV